MHLSGALLCLLSSLVLFARLPTSSAFPFLSQANSSTAEPDQLPDALPRGDASVATEVVDTQNSQLQSGQLQSVERYGSETRSAAKGGADQKKEGNSFLSLEERIATWLLKNRDENRYPELEKDEGSSDFTSTTSQTEMEQTSPGVGSLDLAQSSENESTEKHDEKKDSKLKMKPVSVSIGRKDHADYDGEENSISKEEYEKHHRTNDIVVHLSTTQKKDISSKSPGQSVGIPVGATASKNQSHVEKLTSGSQKDMKESEEYESYYYYYYEIDDDANLVDSNTGNGGKATGVLSGSSKNSDEEKNESESLVITSTTEKYSSTPSTNGVFQSTTQTDITEGENVPFDDSEPPSLSDIAVDDNGNDPIRAETADAEVATTSYSEASSNVSNTISLSEETEENNVSEKTQTALNNEAETTTPTPMLVGQHANSSNVPTADSTATTTREINENYDSEPSTSENDTVSKVNSEASDLHSEDTNIPPTISFNITDKEASSEPTFDNATRFDSKNSSNIYDGTFNVSLTTVSTLEEDSFSKTLTIENNTLDLVNEEMPSTSNAEDTPKTTVKSLPQTVIDEQTNIAVINSSESATVPNITTYSNVEENSAEEVLLNEDLITSTTTQIGSSEFKTGVGKSTDNQHINRTDLNNTQAANGSIDTSADTMNASLTAESPAISNLSQRYSNVTSDAISSTARTTSTSNHQIIVQKETENRNSILKAFPTDRPSTLVTDSNEIVSTSISPTPFENPIETELKHLVNAAAAASGGDMEIPIPMSSIHSEDGPPVAEDTSIHEHATLLEEEMSTDIFVNETNENNTLVQEQLDTLQKQTPGTDPSEIVAASNDMQSLANNTEVGLQISNDSLSSMPKQSQKASVNDLQIDHAQPTPSVRNSIENVSSEYTRKSEVAGDEMDTKTNSINEQQNFINEQQQTNRRPTEESRESSGEKPLELAQIVHNDETPIELNSSSVMDDINSLESNKNLSLENSTEQVTMEETYPENQASETETEGETSPEEDGHQNNSSTATSASDVDSDASTLHTTEPMTSFSDDVGGTGHGRGSKRVIRTAGGLPYWSDEDEKNGCCCCCVGV